MSRDKEIVEPTSEQRDAPVSGVVDRLEIGETQVDQKRAARRKFLKAGAVSAPLVLTFRSTSAWALSAGCLVEVGDRTVPGQLIAVDENFEPILKPGADPDEPGDDKYETIFVTQGVNDVADGNVDRDRLRALVYNNNIGISCLQSITDFQGSF